jgi:hypothetical protein
MRSTSRSSAPKRLHTAPPCSGRAGRLIGYTRLADGDLMLRIEPDHDGNAVEVGAHRLAEATAEANRLLALY